LTKAFGNVNIIMELPLGNPPRKACREAGVTPVGLPIFGRMVIKARQMPIGCRAYGLFYFLLNGGKY